MKKLFMLAVLGLLSVAVYAAEEVVTIRSDVWMPINGDPQSNYRGYAVEMADAIFSKAGIKVDYEIMPWKSSVEAVRKGTYDAVVGATLKETPDFVFPSEPIGVARDALYTMKSGGWDFSVEGANKEVRVGVVNDYVYSDIKINEYLHQRASTARVVRTIGGEPAADNVGNLVKGDVDVVVETPAVFAWYIKQMGLKLSDFEEVSIGAPENCYLAFSPAKESSRKYAKIFSEGVKAMRASGELKTILGKYGVKDWVK